MPAPKMPPRTESRLVLAALLVATAAAGSDLSEILAQNSAARGGYQTWQAVRSARLTGTMTVNDEATAPVVMEFKRPNKVRVEFELGGLTGIQAFDGENGWVQMPFAAQPEPRMMTAAELEEVAATADFDGPLVDYQAKGYQAESVGSTRVNGRDAHQLRLTHAGGAVIDLYLDAETHLEIRQSLTVARQGRRITVHTTLGDYRAVGGLVLPHSLEIGFEGLPLRQVLTIDTVELDPEIPDRRFAPP